MTAEIENIKPCRLSLYCGRGQGGQYLPPPLPLSPASCLKILYACVCLLFMSVKSPCGLAFSVLVGRHVLLNVAPEDIPVEI